MVMLPLERVKKIREWCYEAVEARSDVIDPQKRVGTLCFKKFYIHGWRDVHGPHKLECMLIHHALAGQEDMMSLLPQLPVLVCHCQKL